MQFVHLSRCAFAFLGLAGAIALFASAACAEVDGRLIARAACQPKNLTYPQWLDLREQEHAAETTFAAKHGVALPAFDALRRVLPGPEEFAQRRALDGVVCERLTYASGGLKVIGYIWRPRDIAGKHLPLIVFNRGGGQDLGKLAPREHDGFVDYLRAGFVVIGSQYRGNDGGEGHDEEGGAEVADVVNLVPLARSLGFVDTDNLFMIGESRGAMMTFLSMQAGVKMRAVAVVGAETDLASNLRRRPELREGYEKDTPGFKEAPEAAMRRRSAQAWPQDISAPVLMMHGGRDWRVPPTQDLAFAQKLEALHKPYQLVVFEGDAHLLPFHWRERDRMTIEWFRRHMTPAADPAR